MMCQHLCTDTTVPTLDDIEFHTALEHFSTIDKHYKKESSFISYLYILEYILHKMERRDLVPFLSRIQCRTRRSQYNCILDKVFGTRVSVPPCL